MRFNLISPGYRGVTDQWDASRLVNWFVARGVSGSKAEFALLGTPGTVLRFNVGTKPIRGMHVLGNVLYVVSGNNLYSVSASGAVTIISTGDLITNVGPVVMKDNALQASGTGGNQLMIVDGAAGYVYNAVTGNFFTCGTPEYSVAGALTAGTFLNQEAVTQATSGATALLIGGPPDTSGPLYLANIVGASTSTGIWTGAKSGATYTPTATPVAQSSGWPSAAPVALEYIDGYFVVGAAGSQALYASNLYDGTFYNPLAVAYAQAASDLVQAFVNMQEQLCVIKQYTTEFWYDTGTATTVGFPFSRQSAAVIDYGTPAPASVARGVGCIYMLASRRTQDSPNFIGVVSIYDDLPTVISPPSITKQMQAWAPYLDVVGFCYEQDGHSFYEVTSPSANQTFVYDASIGEPSIAWHERSTYVSGAPYEVNRHVANCYVYFNGMHLVGDWQTGNIYELRTDTYQDNGNPLVAVRTAQIIADEKKMLHSVQLHKLVVDAQVGVDGSIAFSWSDDGGNTWSAEYVHSMRAVGDYRGIDPWMPIGLHPYGMIPRISVSDNCPRTILGGYII